MSVMKEWKCAAHGSFEGTHPICPTLGCLSDAVEREFRTAPSIRSGMTDRTDRGLRKTADMMRINNWRSARAGESSFAGRGVDAPLGTEVLWGNEVAKHPGMGGRSFAALTQAAATPLDPASLNMPPERAAVDPYLTKNNGMRAAATTLGVTRNVLPPAEVTRPLAPERIAS